MKDDRLVEMRVFKAVAESGSFTAAAHLLGISQPFVSQTVTSLEKRLGVQLLHRSTRNQRLTTEGDAYLTVARKVLDDVEQAEDLVRSPEPAGDLRLSAPLAFGMDQVVPQLAGFMEAYPRINLHLSLSDTLVNLLEDHFDVAIRMGKLQDSALMSRRLCNLQRIVVASPGYIARHGQPVTPHGLSRHNCLMWQSPMDRLNRWPFMISGSREEFAVNGSFRSSNGWSLFQLCVAGVGIMRLAEHLAVPAIQSGQLVPLLADYQAEDDTAIHIVFLPERKLVPRIRAVVDHMVDAFRQPPWSR
ncbi:LysR family transcriptional regulator [Ramlibacter sp. AW1]|uniref:LysR family transcriptional regulator n=1 Tax=Ramlibacter aurantiacus TaxID=2801330 RepID=A0A937D3G3_9BURK|nr:LysR family transcriptional regulator [Ramlibacter aurantiacus]MBL0420695.1 LysR family transcriptional regulator [Ramlibacter aurantiacus]